jgi:hypothetical protein
MSEFSDDMAAVAKELITEFGESGSFNRNVEGEYNPQSGEPFGETSISYSGMVVPTDYKDYEIDGTIIQKGDIKILAHNMSEVPTPNDTLTFGDFYGKIINVFRTRVNSADVIYTLQVRK